MAELYKEPQEEDQTLLSGSDESELASSKPTSKKRITGFVVGLALVGVALVALLSSGASLRHGNVGAAVQFDEASSKLFIIKHTFKKESDAEPWWGEFKKMMSSPDKMEEMKNKVADLGFFNVYFMPTKPDGPFYCIWEAKAGKTKEDMEDFINNNKLSPASSMKNEVMPIDLDLTGGLPLGMSDYFSHSFEGKMVSTSSSFYIVEHTFKSDDKVQPFWDQLKDMMGHPDKAKKWGAAVADAGFHNVFMFPTQVKGPIFCIWEAKEGKDKEDLDEFVNKNKLNKLLQAFHNEVMPISSKLTGGMTQFKPFFKSD